jgi:hypothetical protein
VLVPACQEINEETGGSSLLASHPTTPRVEVSDNIIVPGYGYGNRCVADAACTQNNKARGGDSEDSVGNLINNLISTDEGGRLRRYHT